MPIIVGEDLGALLDRAMMVAPELQLKTLLASILGITSHVLRYLSALVTAKGRSCVMRV
ncbi:transcriptional regulator, ArsR family [Alicyclobacillus hesperidum URH17-3-68]|nr:transcriptional regulator, ArsR family [Alicyclobacillus hesperidum URH17-3-68]